MLSLINVLLKLCAFSHKCTVPSLLSPVNSPRFYILCWITKKLSPQCSKITWRSAYKSSLSSWSRCHGIWLLLFLCVMAYGFYFFMRHGMAFTFFYVSWYGFYFFMCHGMAFTFLCVMVWLLLTSVHISGPETQTYCTPLHLPPTVRYRTFLGQCEHITEREIWGVCQSMEGLSQSHSDVWGIFRSVHFRLKGQAVTVYTVVFLNLSIDKKKIKGQLPLNPNWNYK